MSEATVRFGRLEQRGLLLGLSAVQVGLCGAAVFVAVMAEYGAGIPGVVVSAPLWGLLLAVAVVPVRGRPIVAWFPIWAGWTTRSRDGHSRQRHDARTRLTGEGSTPVPLQMPGSAGRLCIWKAPASGAALVHDRAESTITGVLRVSGSGFVLADQGTRLGLISGWGQAMSGLCHQLNVVRVQILARTVADSAEPMRRWWGPAMEEPSTWANRVVSELLAQAQSDARRTETLLAVSIRPAKVGAGPDRACSVRSSRPWRESQTRWLLPD